MGLPFGVGASKAIGEAVFDVSYAMPRGKGIAHEGNAPFPRRVCKRVIYVVSDLVAVEVPIAILPAEAYFGVLEGIGRVVEESKIDFATQNENCQQQQQDERISLD